jgi:hypothetical protein
MSTTTTSLCGQQLYQFFTRNDKLQGKAVAAAATTMMMTKLALWN